MRNDIDFGKYNSQRHAAIRRGISWELTFEQWIEWWKATSKYHLRGRKGHEYCMCRIGDKGPYSLDNIYCATNNQNTRDARLNGKNPKFGKCHTGFLGKHHSAESIKLISKNNANKLKPDMIEERIKIYNSIDFSRHGALGKFAEALNVSHTQARRFINKHVNN